MPVVISNTSPLQYLHQTEMLFLLPELYGQILIPQSVLEELQAGKQRGVSLPDLENLSWVKVRRVQQRALLPLVTHLGNGEKETLALGLEISDSLLLLDDRNARRHGDVLSLRTTGTLGVLLYGKERGIINTIYPVLDRLDALGFRLHPSTRKNVLRLASETG